MTAAPLDRGTRRGGHREAGTAPYPAERKLRHNERKRSWPARTGLKRIFTRSLVSPRTRPTRILRRLTASWRGSITRTPIPGMLLRRRSLRTFPRLILFCRDLRTGSSMTPYVPWVAPGSLPVRGRGVVVLALTVGSRTCSVVCLVAARVSLRVPVVFLRSLLTCLVAALVEARQGSSVLRRRARIALRRRPSPLLVPSRALL